jgi:hypothetical protein
MSSLAEVFGEVIHSYSRAQAIADGVLVDVGSRERMFKFPVAMTQAAYSATVAWPDSESLGALQDEAGRLHDVLWMTALAARRPGKTDRMKVQLHVVPRGSTSGKTRLVELEAVCGPGDNFEPVITIQFPGED